MQSYVRTGKYLRKTIKPSAGQLLVVEIIGGVVVGVTMPQASRYGGKNNPHVDGVQNMIADTSFWGLSSVGKCS